MKRPLQLSLAITLALCGTNALALGLGPARVYSKLNQPLNAEIPVIQGSAGEAEGLLVTLANAEDFERIGLSRSRLRVPLEFAIGKDAQGGTVIKVTSKDPVRESYLDFLVEANWPKGRLLREYTMLLDPPLTAPTRSVAASTAPAAAPARSATSLPLRETAAAPASAPSPVVRSAPKPAPAAAAKASDGDYGPIAAGDTLFEIARANAPGSNVNQMMLALLKNNPQAFYKSNINALKRGAILRIPSADELAAVGSAHAAAAAVQAQIEDWRGGRASPALVADAASGTPAATPAATSKPAKAAKASTASARVDDERLQLVPPKAGKDSLAMADRAGSGAKSAAPSTELKSELARTRESLAATEQESSELKSRVKALEDIKNKNDRLLSLKDSEIAELQQKLKQMQSTPASAPAAVASSKAVPETAPPAAAAAPAATTEEPIDKNDIWGQGEKPGTDAQAPNGKADPAPSSSTDAVPPSGTDAAPAQAGDSGSSSKPVTPPTSEPAIAETAVAGSAAAPSNGAAPVLATSATPTAETVPLAEAPKAAPPPPAVAKPAPAVAPKPAASTPVVAEPWYEASWVKPAALGGGALLLLLGLLGLRKRKTPVVARESIADSFGDSPLGAAAAPGSLDVEERELLAQLSDDPDNAGLHLELLSVYFAQRDIAKFEDAAALMHARIHDPHQAEWVEAQAMGRELAPENPLFTSTAHYYDADVDAAVARVDDDLRDELESARLNEDSGYTSYDETVGREIPAVMHDDPVSYDALHEAPVGEPARDSHFAESSLGFGIEPADIGDFMHTPSPPPVPSTLAADDLGFELPPLDFDKDSEAEVVLDADTTQAPALDLDEDYFAGGDAIGTKLDLAKAYMDMGDPEGARSMLEEVLAEGNDEQRTEAHRLITELG